jgi:enterochelin esterase-like enzyme
MDRRLFLASSVAVVGCRRRERAAERTGAAPSVSSPLASDPRANLEVLDWDLTDASGERRCVVLVPKGIKAGTKLPLLIALHGLGETTSAKKGAYGWLDSYQLDQVLQRLRMPPLDSDAFQGLVTETRLTEINAELAKRPYGGLIIACPYVPKTIGGELTYETYGQWLGERLIPKLRNETPAIATTAATGIDGVSLGGITSLRIGLARADLFGAIGALQPAVNDEDIADALAATIAEKLAGRPLRIVTSTEDAYRTALEALDRKLWDRKVTHQFFITEGPHDYVWNQGPGGIEMVLWHDRVLRA